LEIEFQSFNTLNKEIVCKYLSEDNFHLKFDLKRKLYYNFVRKIVPLKIRQGLQKNAVKNIRYNDDFIWDEYVNLVNENGCKIQYPEGNKWALVLTHDVETEEGLKYVPNIINVENKFGFKSSFNIVPHKYNIDDGIINLIKETGNEVGIHGYNHDGRLYYSEKIFNERAVYINEALKKYDSVGFRSPQMHRNLKWLQKLNIEYDASCFDYDPFQPFPGGTGSIWPFKAGKFWELPYTLPQDHILFYVLGVKNIDIWKRKADWVIANNGVVLILTHPDYLKEREYIKWYEELLGYLKGKDGGYHCLAREVGGVMSDGVTM
jgi:peptidoglycan/xylan/chitin deacetylase (PgdA/CDA1 family)